MNNNEDHFEVLRKIQNRPAQRKESSRELGNEFRKIKLLS